MTAIRKKLIEVALAQRADENQRVYDTRRPIQEVPDFGGTRVNCNSRRLLTRAEVPK